MSQLPISSAFQEWQRELLSLIPKFLLNYARYRDWFEAERVETIAKLTRGSFENIDSADEALVQRHDHDDPGDDEALVRLFHRRALCLSMTIAGTDPDDKTPLFHKLDPILESRTCGENRIGISDHNRKPYGRRLRLDRVSEFVRL